MANRGKRYTDAVKGYDKLTPYPAGQALELVKTFATAKFDETVEAVFKLGIDARKADQLVRGTISLPHGTGKEVRVAVFAPADKFGEAEEAGADVVGGTELVEQLQAGGSVDFDVAIATPDMMAEVGKLGRLLGPPWAHAQPQVWNGDTRRGQGSSRVQSGKARIPQRSKRQCACSHRQGVFRHRAAPSESGRPGRRIDAGQARWRQGALRAPTDRVVDDGAGSQDRHGPNRGSGRQSRVSGQWC